MVFRVFPVFVTGLLLLSGNVTPVRAHTQVEPMRGSYFGSLLSSQSDQWSSDFTVYTQDGRAFGGELSVTGLVQQAVFSGTCSNGKFTITSRPTAGQSNLHIRLTGTIQPQTDPNEVLLQGTYTVRGAMNQKGTFTYQGSLAH